VSVARNRNVIAGLVAILWGVSSGAWRQLVWQDVREGMTDLSPFDRVTRAVLRGGFVLLFVVVGLLLASGVTRSLGTLVPLGTTGLIPLPLIPLTLLLLTFTWAFILTGALGSHPLLRVALFTVYLAGAFGRLGLSSGLTGSSWEVWVGLAVTALIPAYVLVRWRRPLRGAPEFSVLLLLVGLNYAFVQREALTQWLNTGMPLGMVSLVMNVTELGDLVAVLLLLIGLDIATFTRAVSGWTQNLAVTSLPRSLTTVLLAVTTVLLAVANARDLLEWTVTWNPANVASTAVLCVTVPLLAFAAHRLVRHWSPAGTEGDAQEDRLTLEAQRASLPLVMIASALLLLVVVLSALLALVFGLAGVFGLSIMPAYHAFMQVVSWLGGQVQTVWVALIALGGLVVARAAARRGRVAVALYLATFALLEARALLFHDGFPFGEFLDLPSAGVRLAWLAVVIGAGLMLRARRELDGARAATLLGITVGVFLISQEQFIENPFSPMFGALGAAFIGFSLVWDAVTSGAWTNEDSRAFPRLSRVFLYLGYVLLVAVLVNWAVTTHNLNLTERFTGDAALEGFNRFGKPLVYAAFVLALHGLFRRDATPDATQPEQAPREADDTEREA